VFAVLLAMTILHIDPLKQSLIQNQRHRQVRKAEDDTRNKLVAGSSSN
jgi:hypothetical protein